MTTSHTQVYFERQQGRFCVLHAINNAMQGRIVTKDMLFKEVDSMLDTMEERNRKRETSFNRGAYKSYLCAKDGFFSPPVAFNVLKRAGWIAKRVKSIASTGKFILNGKINGYGHTIAVVNGLVLDSEKPNPIKLPAKTYFRKFRIEDQFELVPVSQYRASTPKKKEIIVLE